MPAGQQQQPKDKFPKDSKVTDHKAASEAAFAGDKGHGKGGKPDPKVDTKAGSAAGHPKDEDDQLV